jgi:hypothetical protein
MTAMVWRPTTKQLEIIAELSNARILADKSCMGQQAYRRANDC